MADLWDIQTAAQKVQWRAAMWVDCWVCQLAAMSDEWWEMQTAGPLVQQKGRRMAELRDAQKVAATVLL